MTIIERPKFFAITGGPGAGKTTLLRHLEQLGEAIVPESARAVIQAEIRRSGQRPSGAPFCRLMLQADIAAFHAASGRTFFDRSLVDASASAKLDGLPCPQAEDAVRTLRYAPRAFIAPPWRSIYVQDAERIQTWSEACISYEACAAAYAAARYEVVELPRADVAARAAFVLEVTGAA